MTGEHPQWPRANVAPLVDVAQQAQGRAGGIFLVLGSLTPDVARDSVRADEPHTARVGGGNFRQLELRIACGFQILGSVAV